VFEGFFLVAFFVVVVDIRILVVCMTGFLHTILELPAAASERRASVLALGENSGLKEPASRTEILYWPGEEMERRCDLSTTRYSRKSSF